MNATSSFFKWHDTFIHRTRVSARLTTRSGLRVGAGRTVIAALTDLPVLRDASGRPFLPGSSIKGSLRAFAESLLRGMAVAAGADPGDEALLRRVACDPLGHHCLRDLSRQEKEADKKDDTPTDKREENKENAIESQICLACATFGAPYLASHVRFSDAVLEGGQVSRRDGVAIDRDLGRVSGSLKYDYEVLSPGAGFELDIHLANDESWQTALVLLAVDELSRGGIRLGGFGSRGLGVVEVQDPQVRRLTLDDLLDQEEGTILDLDDVRRSGVEALANLVRKRVNNSENPSTGEDA